MVWQDIGHTNSTKEDGVILHQSIKPIVRHHLAVLLIIITACKIKVIKLKLNPKLPGSRLKSTHTFWHDLFTDPISWNDSNFWANYFFLSVHW